MQDWQFTAPAFPHRQDSQNVPMEYGINVLQYFMAHAPAVPDWFEAKDTPDPPTYVKRIGPGVERRAREHQENVDRWKRQVECLRSMQWPRFWAESQIRRSHES